MKAGEYQAGKAPYGYKKDTEIKNHLVIDEYASEIVKEIFDMYVNKGMSAIKIADKLNERNIEAPCVYMKIPVCMKRESRNPKGYIWRSDRIAMMLRNEVYIGNVVGRKFQKISHKVEKVRGTKREEYVIVKDMHEPIIDELIWRKAQDKLNKRGITKTMHYTHPLKEYLYCAECGGKATYRVRKRERKNGNIWEQKTFICSNKNTHRNNCTCKPIDESIIIEKVEKAIKEEIEQISYTDDEIMKIYKRAEEKVKTKMNILKAKENEIQQKLKENEQAMQEVYQDKIQKLITADDFSIIYQKMQKDKNNLLFQIHQIETEMLELEKEDIGKKYIEMIKIAKSILNLEKPSIEQYSKLIKKIKFDSDKNVIVEFTFGKTNKQEEYKVAI